MAAWLLIAPFRRAFARDHDQTLGATRGVIRAWPFAWPVALALRAGLQHRDIPPSFDVVALLANMVLLTGWRSAFAATLGLRHTADHA